MQYYLPLKTLIMSRQMILLLFLRGMMAHQNLTLLVW